MFSPIEYVSNLNRISLLNGIVAPWTQVPSSVPGTSPVPAVGIPVIPAIPTVQPECNDVIGVLASSQLTLKIAAIVGTALILAYFIKKYGRTVLAAMRSKIQHILVSIENKIRKQRTVYLLAPAQSVVMG